MSCPNIDRWVDFVNSGAEPDPELEAHLDGCLRCREDLLIVHEMVASLTPDIEVPESLIQRTIADFPENAFLRSRTRITLPQVVAAGLLGFISAAGALLASGEAFSAGPLPPLVTSTLVAGVAMALQGPFNRGTSSPEVSEA